VINILTFVCEIEDREVSTWKFSSHIERECAVRAGFSLLLLSFNDSLRSVEDKWSSIQQVREETE